jgi:hypothetical protein
MNIFTPAEADTVQMLAKLMESAQAQEESERSLFRPDHAA